MLKRFATNYVQRHRNRANQMLHMVGVPMTFVLSVVFAVQGFWWWSAAAFVGGYVLQFIGHAIEGNDAGETILVKRLLNRPYTEFGPLAKESEAGEVVADSVTGDGTER